MRQLGEQWIDNGRMYKAIEGPKIVNGVMEGNTCHGCCYVDNWDDDCLHPSKLCPLDKGLIIHDLGPVNEDGCLVCPFCGEYPIINSDYNDENKKCFDIICTNEECGCSCETLFYLIKQQAIDAWNRRV